MTVGTKGCICASICAPPRMRSNAVGGRLLNSSLAWDGAAVMMPLQSLTSVSIFSVCYCSRYLSLCFVQWNTRTSSHVHSYGVTHMITNNNIYKSERVMKSYDTSAHSPPPPHPPAAFHKRAQFSIWTSNLPKAAYLQVKISRAWSTDCIKNTMYRINCFMISCIFTIPISRWLVWYLQRNSMNNINNSISMYIA